MSSIKGSKQLNFNNTETAFAHKTKQELKKSRRLFRVMCNPTLVNLMSPIGLFAIKYNLPFAKTIVKKTIFSQFIGGTTLKEAQAAIDSLSDNKCSTFLDYGVEGKESAEDFDRTKDCLLYTSPSPRDGLLSRMPSSA